MSNPPPPFRSTVEESLSIPDNSDQLSTTSSTRRWDDPPEELPPLHHASSSTNNHHHPNISSQPEIENITSMVFIKSLAAKHPYNSEICTLQFSPCDTYLAALIPRTVNIRTFHPDEPATISIINIRDGSKGFKLQQPSYNLRASGGFAFKPSSLSTGELVIACPFFSKSDGSGEVAGYVPKIEIYDVTRKVRWTKHDLPLRAPICFSPDGNMLGGVSTRDNSRIVLCNVRKESCSVRTMVLKHTEEVTKVKFMGDGLKLVSAGRDGYVRITSLESGRTLNRVEIAGRPGGCNILEVAGDRVVSVWGRDVVIWDLNGGQERVHSYNLNSVRGNGVNEGWPLAVSPDCRYIVCRTEEGFDVSDVETGRFRGDFCTAGSVVTCAAFTRDGKKIAIGNYDGQLQVYDVVTV
ncbi:WD40-repeat-containing domain protein [Podospora fimiseda]|uniref:Mitochondrial division protein 1 n=1 Tax=Podospora fimiseda TaxID=252190 RepID=A0AAN6YTX6_9PEZI|nr:WD40-repeat-containing domain protein [Podospora fimiseda]